MKGMGQFEPFDEGVEVNGQTVLAVVDGVPDPFRDRAHAILAASGIEDPQPNEWYPQEAWLAAFEEIWTDVGDATLRGIGRAVPEQADWPGDVETAKEGLESIDRAHNMNHRGGDVGFYQAEQLARDLVEVTCKTPYPCAFDQGVVQGAAEAFDDVGLPRVTETSARCRDEGGEKCVYEVEL